MTEKNNKNILYCSFCGKSQHEVRKLIAGPTVFICDECVELCMDIIKEKTKFLSKTPGWRANPKRNLQCFGRICNWPKTRKRNFIRSRSQSL